MNTTKTKRAEPIKVEQITTPVTMGCTILAIAILGVIPLMCAFPKQFAAVVFLWLIVCIIKNNTK